MKMLQFAVAYLVLAREESELMDNFPLGAKHLAQVDWGGVKCLTPDASWPQEPSWDVAYRTNQSELWGASR